MMGLLHMPERTGKRKSATRARSEARGDEARVMTVMSYQSIYLCVTIIIINVRKVIATGSPPTRCLPASLPVSLLESGQLPQDREFANALVQTHGFKLGSSVGSSVGEVVGARWEGTIVVLPAMMMIDDRRCHDDERMGRRLKRECESRLMR